MIVEATITSPSSAIIGAALKSSVGTINVNIIDNCKSVELAENSCSTMHCVSEIHRSS